MCFFSEFRWIWLLALSVFVTVESVEFMKTDSDFGELFLVQNHAEDGEWNVLYIERGMYFKRDSSLNICLKRHEYYTNRCIESFDFLPSILTVQLCPQKKFPNKLFQTSIFARLHYFKMSNVGVSEFHQSGLIGADALTSLILSYNMLTEMPSKAFSSARNLTEIDLSHNEIGWMASDVFETESDSAQTDNHALRYLEKILLNHNQLKFINSGWFSGLVKLTTLTLNDNFLTEISGCAAFSTNTALRSLQLQNNEFSVIKTNGLSDSQCLNNLNSFDISSNLGNNGTEIIRVNAQAISISNTNAQQCFIPNNAVIVRAEHNRIDAVVVDELPNTSLRELFLSHNKINSTDFLFDLEHLKIIDLSHNELMQVNGEVFENMPNLATLNIGHNKFASIDLTFLMATQKLTHLDISNNLLSGSFKLHVTAAALSELNISNNNFTLVQHDLRTQTPNLTSIDINGNHFDCDDLASIILFLNLDHITLIIRSDGDFGNADNVRGIQCHQTNEEWVAVGSTQASHKTTKEQLIKTIDDKFVKLETKLIDLFNNVTTSEIDDNKI